MDSLAIEHLLPGVHLPLCCDHLAEPRMLEWLYQEALAQLIGPKPIRGSPHHLDLEPRESNSYLGKEITKFGAGKLKETLKLDCEGGTSTGMQRISGVVVKREKEEWVFFILFPGNKEDREQWAGLNIPNFYFNCSSSVVWTSQRALV